MMLCEFDSYNIHNTEFVRKYPISHLGRAELNIAALVLCCRRPAPNFMVWLWIIQNYKNHKIMYW